MGPTSAAQQESGTLPGPASPRLFRFGSFELDARTGELSREGQKIRLPEQAFQILELLLGRPGEVVGRDELRQRLWKAGTFVDFEVGLNSAVRKLREALDDSAENPTFVETLPRRGYRFIAPVEAVPGGTSPRLPANVVRTTWWVRMMSVAGGVVMVAVIAMLAVSYQRGSWPRAGPAANEIRSTRRPRAVDPAASAAYQKGVFAAGQLTYEGVRTAVAYFEEAIAKQPDYAEAYAALAHAQVQFLFVGPLSPRQIIPKAEAAARKAMELDETLPRPHETLGTILTHFYWKWDEGDQQFRRARQLSVTAGTGRIVLIRTERSDEAIAQAVRARRQDPLSVNAQINLAIAYRAAGQYDRAIAEFRRALEMAPGHSRTRFQMGATFLLMGRQHAAIREFEAAVAPVNGNPRMTAYLGYAYAAAGRTADARRVLNQLVSRARDEYVSSFGIALIHDALGEKEPALAALERAYEDRAVEFAQMSQYPPFKTIASDPRYDAVMRRIGLPR